MNVAPRLPQAGYNAPAGSSPTEAPQQPQQEAAGNEEADVHMAEPKKELQQGSAGMFWVSQQPTNYDMVCIGGRVRTSLVRGPLL